ncbi:formylmethanofuran dehydrogenase subunit E [Methanomicrobium sp. W14]|uniref:TraR/DksA C4-type zinc finger protein n=1 Tax=Methanomicrobium sp. W14 TaxID=2817839 RepID=UPI001AE10C84|nr:TraR/DksA C4-type zinc finger protein [Methanomicrobium sp. W14]MBP2134421.1 formylmethanofuran dehydrogenase subunit E [Methanomicrobium sp. W14]
MTFRNADLPGFTVGMVKCSRCNEIVRDSKEVVTPDGEVLCKNCANGSYYYKV